MVAFALVAAPNVVFLTRETGKFRIEAKGTLAYAWGERINRGMSYAEAVKGIGDDLSEQGVFMRPNRDVITSTSYTLRDYGRFLGRAARRNASTISQTVSAETSFGAPVLFALVVLGLFAQPWNRRRVVLDGALVASAALLIAVLLTVQDLWLRYFFSLLGLMLIWAAQGAVALGAWTVGTLRANGTGTHAARRGGTWLTWTSVALMLMLGWRELPQVEQFRESMHPETADAGRWVRSHFEGRPRVMDIGDQVAFYAGGDLIYLPFTSSGTALRYIERKAPDFVILQQMTRNHAPYTARWFDEGIPDPRAELVHDSGPPGDSRVKIYRWNAGAAPPHP